MTGVLRLALLTVALSTIVLHAQSPLERAVTLAREKRYAEAQQALAGATEPSERNQRIAFHRLRAAIHSGLGDGAGALKEMDLALALAPNDATLLTGAAMTAMSAGKLDAARAYALKAGPNATAKAVLGDIEEKRGDPVAAVKAYREAVALAPDREEFRVSLAYALIEHQDFRSARALLEPDAAARVLHSPRLATLLGIALYSDGEPARARLTLAKALTADPANDAAYRCLARIVLLSAAAPEPAVVEQLCRRAEQTACAAMQLRVSRETGDDALRTRSIEQLRRANPADAAANCELARAWEWAGRLADARHELEACVRADPSPQNHYRLGRLYQRLGLDEQSRAEMSERARLLNQMSEETAAGLSALRAIR